MPAVNATDALLALVANDEQDAEVQLNKMPAWELDILHNAATRLAEMALAVSNTKP